MTSLSRDKIERFRCDGVLTVKDAVSPKLLSAMREQFAAWVEESRQHEAAYGAILDGRPRFDLEPGRRNRGKMAPGFSVYPPFQYRPRDREEAAR